MSQIWIWSIANHRSVADVYFFYFSIFFINCPGTDAMLSVHKLFAHKCEGHGFEFGHPLSELARVFAIFLDDKEKN